jgi:hypothetical protein
VAYVGDHQPQAHLGRILRAIYEPMLQGTLPNALRNLLEALDHREMTSRFPPEGRVWKVGKHARGSGPLGGRERRSRWRDKEASFPSPQGGPLSGASTRSIRHDAQRLARQAKPG